MAILPPINTEIILEACEKAEKEIKEELKHFKNYFRNRRHISKNRLWWIGEIREMARIANERKFYCLHLDHNDILAIGKFLKINNNDVK